MTPFASASVYTSPTRYERILGIEVVSAYAQRLRLLIFRLTFFLLISMAGSCYLLWQLYSINRSITSGEAEEDDQVEAETAN